MKNSSKVITLKEAVKQFVHDDCHISFGGFTVNRQPMACAYEIIRQKIENLHVYIHSGGQALDVLVGAGCVKAVEIAYGANGRFAPTCVCFRRAVEKGELSVEDYTNYQMTLRFLAGAMGVPFLPVKSGMGTDIVKRWGFDAEMRRKDPRLPNQKLLVQNNPFAKKKNEPLVLVPAINPDVTVIHAQQADSQGTVRIAGLSFADVEQARASRHVIVTCEELVEPGVMRAEPDRNQIPFFVVDAVVHVPFGAHPTACYGCYDYDARHLNMYRGTASEDEKFKQYLDEFVFSVKNQREYLEKIGSGVLESIRAVPPYGYAAGLQRGASGGQGGFFEKSPP
ncbi:MAG: CoA transferase subunit A [Candidatus Aminicenantes bacterium]|nr:CoA transferase subunit A [Candidatus Aminicenantes bacterium]